MERVESGVRRCFSHRPCCGGNLSTKGKAIFAGTLSAGTRRSPPESRCASGKAPEEKSPRKRRGHEVKEERSAAKVTNFVRKTVQPVQRRCGEPVEKRKKPKISQKSSAGGLTNAQESVIIYGKWIRADGNSGLCGVPRNLQDGASVSSE